MKRLSKRLLAGILVFSLVAVNLLLTKPTSIAADTVLTITECGGWLESAYVEWTATEAEGFNVYVKQTGSSEYTQIDDELIRNYGTYYRADALGLAAGEYTMKIVAVIKDNGEKTESKVSVETGVLNVAAHDRTGFAWVNGTSSGAYNEDGTLKSDAVVLYITEQTKDTVTMEVVTSSSGAKTTATGLQNILAAYKKGYETRPLAIRLIGNISDFSTMESGDILIKGSSSSKRLSCGITFEGVGEDATCNGWGLRIANASNVEVRNLGFMNCNSGEGDDVGLQQSNDHVWVHNCDFFYGDAGSDADQVKGDGALDTKTSTYVTHSYNHFYDTGKSNLQGMKSESTENYITYHHNWYDHSDSRHPRIRTCTVHIYNNYYDGNAKYGVGVTMGASAFVENNYFRNCKYPMLSSMQGSDIADGATGTFSGENGGIIKAYGNYIEGAKRFVDQTYSATDFDAIVVSSADETVPDTYVTVKGGTTYNNFDTSSMMYSYTPDAAENVPAKVMSYAGRMNGGDFSWQFDNSVDDESYAVNTALKAALVSYQTSLVSVGGNGTNGSGSIEVASTEAVTESSAAETTQAEKTSAAETTGTSTESTTSAGTVVTGEMTHNFTTQGKDSSFYTITGNLSTSKGSTTYAGLTLTQCLKMESSTSVSFTAPAEGTLTLVFDTATTKTVKVDGTKVAAVNGVVTVELAAGSHSITKGDSINLFYMSFATEAVEETTEAVSTVEETTAEATTAEVTTAEVTTAATEATTESTTSAPVQTTGKVGTVTNLSTYTDSMFANVVYVSPNGTSLGKGTKASPLDLETAIDNAVAGQTIILLGGTYSYDHRITISNTNNGTSDAYKVLRAADGAEVTLDFSSQPYSNDTATNDRGLQIDGNYWYVYGITVYGAADNGIYISGSNNIVERCVLQANRDTGLQIGRRASSLSDMKDWPANNYIINCTSFDNCDPATGENADGFAAKLTCAEGNVFDGCIAYCNSDDGWDLYAKEATGSIGVVTIKNCIAFNNGTLTNGYSEANGDMNGFKLGGSNGKVPTPHIVVNCLAFSNGKDGFTDNGNGGALSLTNCTSYNNAKSNFNFYRTTAGGYFTNLLSASGTDTNKFIGTLTNSIHFNSKKYYYVSDATTVTSGAKVGTVIDNPYPNEFVSTTAPNVSADIDSLYRNADGTVTTNGYLMVKSSSTYAQLGASFGSSAAEVMTVNVLSKTQETTTAEATTAEATTKAEVTTAETTTKAEVTTAEATTKAEVTTAEATTKAEVTTAEATTKAEVTTAEATTKAEVTTAEATTKAEVTTAEATTAGTVVTEGMTHNFTTQGKDSSFYTISGNLSTSKGSTTYAGLTLTQCLKMESATRISFTAPSEGVLTLVFDAATTKTVKVDGTKVAAVNGVVTVDLEAGSHTITKGDSINLFYMSFAAEAEEVTTKAEVTTAEATTKVVEVTTAEATTKAETTTAEATTKVVEVTTAEATTKAETTTAEVSTAEVTIKAETTKPDTTTEETTMEETTAPVIEVVEKIELKPSELEAGTYTESFVTSGVAILADGDNTVSVVEGGQEVNGTYYAQYLALEGSGSTEYRAIQFVSMGNTEITIVLESTGSTSTRTLRVLDESGEGVAFISDISADAKEYTVTIKEPGVYYLTSLAAGINVYYMSATNVGEVQSLDVEGPKIFTNVGEAQAETLPTEAIALAGGNGGASGAETTSTGDNAPILLLVIAATVSCGILVVFRRKGRA